MEFSLLGAAALGTFSFWLMLRWEAKRGNAAGCAVDLWDAGLLSAISGLFIGRLVAMAQAGINPLTDPAQIILIRSGVSTAATAVATIAVFAFLSRRSLLPAADGIAPAALAGLAGWHAGCLTSGACLGTESNLPWAFALEGSLIARHPVELYTAAALFGASVCIALWKQYGRPPLGAPAGVGLIAASGIRLATEPMRISLEGGPIWLYVVGAIAGAGLVVFSVVRRGRSPTG
ncbi:MAG: prolipoprotein diacylglyceryl transferase family protein [Acidimicrobiia bacterium]